MKTQYLYIAGALLLGATATSCRDEQLLSGGEGRMRLETSIMSDVKVVSRALTDEQNSELGGSAIIWVTDMQSGKAIYKYTGIGSFPQEGLRLVSGQYAAEAWLGDSIPASWGENPADKRYRGYEQFEITSGADVNVALTCPIRNTIVSVEYDQSLKKVLTDPELTVGLNDPITDGSHSLTFEGYEPEHTNAYFMINSKTEGLRYTLKGKLPNGNAFETKGEYRDPAVTEAPYLAQTTKYRIRFVYNADEGDVEIGGFYFNIEVEPEPAGENKEVVIALPPTIKGSDFDINKPLLQEPDAAEPRSVVISASTSLKSLEISGSLLEAAGLYPDYELVALLGSDPYGHLNDIQAKGMLVQPFRQSEENADALTNVRLAMSAEFFNDIAEEGDYEMVIKATDADNQVTEATFHVSITKAPVTPSETNEAEIDFTSVTLSAAIGDVSGVERLGFEIKKAETGRAFEDWTFVAGTVVGKTMTASVTGLEDGTDYVYRAVADDYTSAEMSFSTPVYPQLENAGFEDWYTYSGNILVPGTGYPAFWDTGNHGSSTMSKNVTDYDSSVKHSGNYSARLTSQFVGIGIIGKFAAGNIFAGKYLATDGTDGVLGWGQPFKAKPKKLRGYIKYTPGTVDSKGKGGPENWEVGHVDQGAIYIALLTSQTEAYNGEQWPVVIKTKSSERQLFDPQGANVVAYGIKILDATPGSGMVPFEIDIEDVHGDLEVANIVVVASASRYGDYFCGGEGSTLWIDDLELIY